VKEEAETAVGICQPDIVDGWHQLERHQAQGGAGQLD